jgi:hypothetical protein
MSCITYTYLFVDFLWGWQLSFPFRICEYVLYSVHLPFYALCGYSWRRVNCSDSPTAYSSIHSLLKRLRKNQSLAIYRYFQGHRLYILCIVLFQALGRHFSPFLFWILYMGCCESIILEVSGQGPGPLTPPYPTGSHCTVTNKKTCGVFHQAGRTWS